MAHDDEASVEEILESIKKVIDRDRNVIPGGSQPTAQPAPQSAPPQSHASGDQDAGSLERPDPASEEEADEVLDLADMELEQPPALELGAESGDTPLVTEAVRGAMEKNLEALAMISEPGAKPQIVRSGETSLEGLTRELLRPLLAEWLDANLPAMVEQMVQAEIARIARKRS